MTAQQADLRVRVKHGLGAGQGAGLKFGVGIQQAKGPAPGVVQGEIVGASEAEIFAGLDQADPRKLGTDHFDAAVHRAVVGNDDFQRRLAVRLPVSQ